MTYLRKAAQQALEAIHLWHWASETHLLMAAHDALRIALEQPKQEPVAWMYQDKSTHEVRFQKHMRSFVDHGRTYETPLYTTPPQRPWVGLTDEDLDYLCHLAYTGDEEFALAVQDKLKELNT